MYFFVQFFPANIITRLRISQAFLIIAHKYKIIEIERICEIYCYLYRGVYFYFYHHIVFAISELTKHMIHFSRRKNLFLKLF